MKTIKLQFGGLLQNCNDSESFTCILEEKDNCKRKLFLQLTKAEADEIAFYIKQTNNKKKMAPGNLSDLIKSGYIIKKSRIAIEEEKQIGIINLKRGKEKLQVVLSICAIIILMKNYNIATSIDTKSLKEIKNNSLSLVDSEIKNDITSADEILTTIDEYIYYENFDKMRPYVSFLKKLIKQ